jgi:hypothetical protein
MFRLWYTRHIEYILSLAGYIYVIVCLRSHLTSVPVVYPALIISTFTHFTKFIYFELYSVMYWFVFYTFVFQLVSIHENNLCLLDDCKTTEVQKYIALASTLLMVLQPSVKQTSKERRKTTSLKQTMLKPPINKNQTIKKAATLHFESNNTNVKWV